MKKIVVLGVGPQTHGRPWLPRINADLDLGYRAQWIWDPDGNVAAEMASEYDAEAIDRPDAAIDQVDGAIITTTDPSAYLDQARPFLEKGVPVYLNRPMAGSPAMARQIVALARKHNAPITTGSSLYYSSHIEGMRAQAAELGRLRAFVASTVAHLVFMYLPHAIAVMQRVLGPRVEWVHGFGRWDPDSPPEEPITILAHVQYAQDSLFGPVQGTVQFMNNAPGGYSLKLWGEKGFTQTIDFGRCDIYGNLLKALDPFFVDGREPMSHEDMLAGRDIHQAIVTSVAEERRVTIAEMQAL